MRLVGLTGGIGSGKSTVSEQLRDNGAVVIDADAIVRELQRPGEPVFAAMVQRWGRDVVAEDGTLDRAAVAAIVFNDKDELKALESIVHPVLRTEIERRIAEQRSTENVVVLDMALLTEKANPYEVTEIIVVDLAPETAVDRLVRFRGFSEDDAAKRIAAQANREERLAVATHVIDNNGDLTALKQQVDALWQRLN
ncbi:MAG: dephospho-CoA kinase [Acidimicrobiales bacterium]|nr:dephospho-CoA kinase [Acidimicrobiales bacterium]